MTTQNLHTGPLRSSGHKEPTEDHATVAKMATSGENGDPEALLQGRLLNNPNVGRAALYDETDFLCIASSTKQFDVEPDQVRKILDALLTYARIGDPTFAGGNGAPAKKLHLNEGVVDVKLGDQEKIAGDLNGKTFVAARTAKYVLFVEGTPDANDAALGTIVQSFQEGLQALTWVMRFVNGIVLMDRL